MGGSEWKKCVKRGGQGRGCSIYRVDAVLVWPASPYFRPPIARGLDEAGGRG